MVINLSVKISVQPIWQNVFHKKSVGGFTLGINYGSTVSIMLILEKSIFTTTRGDSLGDCINVSIVTKDSLIVIVLHII